MFRCVCALCVKIPFHFCLQCIEPVKESLYLPPYCCCKHPTFHSVNELLLPENCVNLAKFIAEAEKVKRSAPKTLVLSDVEKDRNLQATLF